MPLKVLFATDHIHFPQGGGGGERSTHELCLALRDHGVEPAVICSLQPDGSWMSWSNRFKRGVWPRHRFPRDMGCGYPVFRGWDQEATQEVVRRFRPEVAVVESTHPIQLLQAFDQCKVPTAVYVREVVELDQLQELAGCGFPVLTNSPFTAQRLLDHCTIPSEVILPLIDRRHYVTSTRPERVLFVNTVPRKGLEIAFNLAKARPDIPFDFVRSWILKPEQVRELERRTRDAGNIMLHEPTNDMRSLYARARVVLVPSQCEEAWGRVATEAHINGIPVIGSDRGGLPQAIGPGGLIVAADAPMAEWLAALSRLWDNADAYASQARAARAYSDRAEIQADASLTNFAHSSRIWLQNACAAAEP